MNSTVNQDKKMPIIREYYSSDGQCALVRVRSKDGAKENAQDIIRRLIREDIRRQK